MAVPLVADGRLWHASAPVRPSDGLPTTARNTLGRRVRADRAGAAPTGATILRPFQPRETPVKKLLLLLVVIAIGVLVAKKVRDSSM
ncbi:MAG TPA: DLW-39 family protein [Acidimicrobiia bacterium]|nr:DLW-39 family protein [Acidimicrobiia bacterium]